jgi:hypothetical protein
MKNALKKRKSTSINRANISLFRHITGKGIKTLPEARALSAPETYPHFVNTPKRM